MLDFIMSENELSPPTDVTVTKKAKAESRNRKWNYVLWHEINEENLAVEHKIKYRYFM